MVWQTNSWLFYIYYILFISPSPVICLRAKVSDNYKQRYFFFLSISKYLLLSLREIYEHLRILFDQQNVYNSVAVKKFGSSDTCLEKSRLQIRLFELLSAEFF